MIVQDTGNMANAGGLLPHCTLAHPPPPPTHTELNHHNIRVCVRPIRYNIIAAALTYSNDNYQLHQRLNNQSDSLVGCAHSELAAGLSLPPSSTTHIHTNQQCTHALAG